MTYSQMVKDELCGAKFGCEECNYFFIYGMLLFRKSGEGDYFFQCDHNKAASLLAQKIVEETGVIVKVLDHPGRHGKKQRIYCLAIEQTEDARLFWDRFDQALKGEASALNIKKPCCRSAFLRGVFLSCGVLVNPAKEYHFEFKVTGKALADKLYAFLSETGLDFRRTTRKGFEILYLKGSEQIEEVLTYMGAVKSALKLMDIKIVKEVRNNVNRVTNCETANIGKTVRASMKQVEDINFILQQKGMEFLPRDLQEVAQLRLENPEMSLNELTREFPSEISRSGLNHRLKKLEEIARELRGNH